MQENQYFYDTLSGRYFKSTIDDILYKQNVINRTALNSPVNERYLDLVNKLRSSLGLPELSNDWVVFVNKPDGSLLDIIFIPVAYMNDKCYCVDFNIHKTK